MKSIIKTKTTGLALLIAAGVLGAFSPAIPGMGATGPDAPMREHRGVGEGYNPSDPPEPVQPDVVTPAAKPKLRFAANPTGAGSFNYPSPSEIAAGSTVSVRAYPSTYWTFESWECEGTVISTDNPCSYTMPDHDVVLTANFRYTAPADPAEPQVQDVSHPVTVRAIPAGSATFNPSSAFTMKEGETRNLYLYPVNGFKTARITLNGVSVDAPDGCVPLVMGQKAIDACVYTVYDPSDPPSVGANSYNPSTGQVIVDAFTPGALYSTTRDLIGGNWSNVGHFIAKGEITSGDLGIVAYMANASTVDFSRVSGVPDLPSYSFFDGKFTTLTLPADVTSIGSYSFSRCTGLNTLVVRAAVPPAVTYYTFDGFTNLDNCTVYVPASSVTLYESDPVWGQMTIMPITDDSHVLQVNLPAECADGRYKNSTIELVNIRSGLRQKYVVSDRLLYTFNGLQKDEVYDIYLRSRSGLELGRIEGVVMPGEDFAVNFTGLRALLPVTARVLTPEGRDVTSGCTVEWMRPMADGSLAYLHRGVSPGEIPAGQQLVCRITPGQQLATEYSVEPETRFTVSEADYTLTVTLAPLPTVTLRGTLTDTDGTPLADATVAAVQRVDRYDKTFSARTGRDGTWSLEVNRAPATQLTFKATECVASAMTLGAFDEDATEVTLEPVALRSVVGARINYAFRYTAAGQETRDYFADHKNVDFSVRDLTQDRALPSLSVVYPQIAVLDEAVEPGDELRITATSRTGAFNPSEQTVTLGPNSRASAVFDLTGRGGISATYSASDNPEVTGMLFGADGRRVANVDFKDKAATFTDLDEGEYTLVAMAKSAALNAAASLSALDEGGLEEGVDYAAVQGVEVRNGILATASVGEVPVLDNSRFNYFSERNTNVTFNKAKVTSGNYLTWNSKVDFRAAYKDGLTDVALVLDLPEGCDMVGNSVMLGLGLVPYTLEGRRLTVPLGDKYTQQLRFCVVPTRAGTLSLPANIRFTRDGLTVLKPCGVAHAEIKDAEFSVPSVVASRTFRASGNAPAGAKVTLYEGDDLLGSGYVNAAGTFNVTCTLPEGYNLQDHAVHAVFTLKEGIDVVTGTQTLTYDANAVKVMAVTMTEGSNKVVFNFENPNSGSKYYYYSFGMFTFQIEFNSPDGVEDCLLYVHCTDGSIRKLSTLYNAAKGLWIASAQFETDALPLNVSLDFSTKANTVQDARRFNALFTGETARVSGMAGEYADEYAAIVAGAGETDAANDAVTAALAEINAAFDGNEPPADAATLVERALTALDPAFDASTLNPATAGEITEEYVAALLARGQELLGWQSEAVETPAADGAGEFLGTLSQWADDPFAFSLDEPLEFEYEGRRMLASILPGADTPQLGLDTMEAVEMPLSDSNAVTLYQGDDVWYLVNGSDGMVMRITAADGTRQLGRLLAKEADEHMLEAIKEQLTDFVGHFRTLVEQLTKKYQDELDNIKLQKADVEAEHALALGKSAGTRMRLADVERQIRELERAGGGGFHQMELHAQRKALEAQRKALLKEAETLGRQIAKCESALGKFSAKLMAGQAILGEITDWWQLIDGAVCLIRYIGTAIVDCYNWNSFIGTILPCPDDTAAAEALVALCRANRNTALRGYAGAFTLAGLGEAIAAVTKFSAPPMRFVTKFLAGIISGALIESSKGIYKDVKQTSHRNRSARIKDRRKLKCHKPDKWDEPQYDDDDDDDDSNSDNSNNRRGGRHPSGEDDSKYGIDPSGYVYESVPSNRVQGVQASIYYKETKEDMYGDPVEEVVMWDAEEYAQQNPLFTDENGMYRWDVPQGLWQVKFEKEGYATAYSEWLPVPPPQLDVNVAIVQTRQPEVTEVHAYESGIDIFFDKYMDIATLTPANIFASASNVRLEGSVEMLDDEVSDPYLDADDQAAPAGARRYASRVRFVPSETLAANAGDICINVRRDVLSYAGIPMAQNFTQTLDIEKEVTAIVADDTKVLYGGTKSLTVHAVPADAAAGRPLVVANASEDILRLEGTEDLAFDAEGKCVLTLCGELPGTSVLTFGIPDVTVTGEATVSVLTEIFEADLPRASRAAGSVLYRGTKVTLESDAEDAVIWYTTDGTCPCDEDGSRVKYTAPITVTDDIEIRAVTVVTNGKETMSETAVFNYTVKRTALDLDLAENWNWVSHTLHTPLALADLSPEGHVDRILGHECEVVNDPVYGFVGDLSELTAESGFKVLAKAGAPSVRLSGVAYNPERHPALHAGWNWIGYPLDRAMTPGEAFADTEAEEFDCLVAQDGFAQYDGTQWAGTIDAMYPGRAYMYLSGSAKPLVWNTGIVSNAAALHATGIECKAPVAVDTRKYPHVMCMIAALYDGDTRVEASDRVLAAFCGTECRGVARGVDGLLWMNVYGNPGDPIDYRLVDTDGAATGLGAADTFAPLISGRVDAPRVFDIKGLSATGDLRLDGGMEITVADGVLRVSGIDAAEVEMISVFNTDGRKMLAGAYDGLTGFAVSHLDRGVYIAVVKAGATYGYHKLTIK